MPCHFLYPLFNYKGNLSSHSYSHLKSFTKSQSHFCCFLAKKIWSRSLGFVSALWHGGTLNQLKQSSEDFSGSEELLVLAPCHSTCSPRDMRTYPSKQRHNEGTSAQLLTSRPSWKKGGILLHL